MTTPEDWRWHSLALELSASLLRRRLDEELPPPMLQAIETLVVEAAARAMLANEHAEQLAELLEADARRQEWIELGDQVIARWLAQRDP